MIYTKVLILTYGLVVKSTWSCKNISIAKNVFELLFVSARYSSLWFSSMNAGIMSFHCTLCCKFWRKLSECLTFGTRATLITISLHSCQYGAVKLEINLQHLNLHQFIADFMGNKKLLGMFMLAQSWHFRSKEVRLLLSRACVLAMSNYEHDVNKFGTTVIKMHRNRDKQNSHSLGNVNIRILLRNRSAKIDIATNVYSVQLYMFVIC